MRGISASTGSGPPHISWHKWRASKAVGNLVPTALASVRKGGTVVLGGIHMSDVPAMPYSLLWGERVIRSVANLTREDAKGFLTLAGRSAIKTHVVAFALRDANVALTRLRAGKLTGAAVLVPP